ncbi:MAG: amidase family protein [Actinomycetota bacterium]|nr:amidase family protein [Actinomycetota bacterium]
MHETLLQSATDAARMLRHKEISSRELTEMLLARIEALNPALNALVELRREATLQEAVAADEAIACGYSTGPLHGVPMTIKDSFNVTELHTTWGNPTFKDFVAAWDATVARRLRQAGSLIVGKTNVAFMLGDFGQTTNELYSVTKNPWDTTCTPGGSSGGSASALSAGMTFLEYGSDLAGSIRIPASFCGVYGLKPSAGIVPLSGFQPPGAPPPPNNMTYISAVGPLGRSARDLRTALSVTGGLEGQAAKAYSWALSPPRHTRQEDFHVGVVLDHEYAPVSSEVTALLSNAVDALARAGATVVEGWPDGVDPVQHYESFGFHVQLFFAFQQPGENFAALPEFIDHENRRMAARAAWNRYFNDTIDVFLCPVNFTPAFPHDTGPSNNARSRHPKASGLITTWLFGCRRRRCRAYPPWPRR